MRIFTRAELHSRPFRTPAPRVPLSARRWFIVHYPGAGTPPRGLEAYRRWIETIHMDQNGWRGVGYNYFVAPNGDVGEGCGRDVQGAHSPPHNYDGFGVNIWTSNGVATPESMHAARQLYDLLCKQTGRKLKIGYHGMDFPTECPGPQLRNWAKAGLPDPFGGTVVTPDPPSKPIDPIEEIMSYYKNRQDFEVRLSEIIAKYVGQKLDEKLVKDIPAPAYANLPKGKTWHTGNVDSYTLDKAHYAHQNAYKANVQSAAVLAVVRELAARGGISKADLAKIEDAAESGARAAIDDKIDNARVTLEVSENE